MTLTTLSQQISDTTRIGKSDILLIMNKAFSILTSNGTTETTLTIPQCGTTPEFNLHISRI